MSAPSSSSPPVVMQVSISRDAPPAAGFAPKHREIGQNGAKLPPVIETHGPLPPAGEAVQLVSKQSVTGEIALTAVETPARIPDEVLQQPPRAGAEPGDRQPKPAPAEIGRRPKSPPPEPLEERALIAEGFALLVSEVRRTNRGGRPTVVDEPMKIRIATLMGAGLSLRQAAACLGIDHATISRAVSNDQELKHEIDIARTRATLHPLACILRESGKNWKAAVWLLEHLSNVAYNEKTPQEKAEISATSSAMTVLQHQLSERMVAEARASLAARKREGQSPAPRRQR